MDRHKFTPKVGDDPRIPPEIDGIEANWCNNAKCENFRKPAINHRNDPRYTLTGGSDGDTALKCRSCNKFAVIKSNLAIAEELYRISQKKYDELQKNNNIKTHKRQQCSNPECDNFDRPLQSFPHFYKKNGKTNAGSQRYECKLCGKSVTPAPIEKRHNSDTHKYKNQIVFKLFVNKVPLNRMEEIVGISKQALLNKLDTFYDRMVEFSYERELRLPSLDIERLYLSTDRQDYNINWTQKQNRRHTTITAIGTADNRSRYVFGMNANYDPEPDLEEISKETFQLGDMSKRRYNRLHARLWTQQDYSEEVRSRSKKKEVQMDLKPFDLHPDIKDIIENQSAYISKAVQPDRHNGEVASHQQLPTKGCLVHSEYTQYAHFLMLSKLFKNVEKVRYYLDFESGIHRAFNLAFGDRIDSRVRPADGFIVMADKGLTIDEKDQLTAQSKKLIHATMMAKNLSEDEAINWLILQSMENPQRFKQNPYDWYAHPVNTRQENNKMVAFITDTGKYDDTHTAKLIQRASLTGIDVFFMLTRRRLSALERPIHTASNSGAVWHGYSPYNPERVEKLLQVLRVYYNYMLVSKIDNKTPAQRLGLAKGEVELIKIIS